MTIEFAYIKHKNYLIRVVNNKFWSLDAEDIVQDLFCSLKQINFDKAPNKLAYLTRAAYNKAIDRMPKVIDQNAVMNRIEHINELREVKTNNRAERLTLQLMIKGQSYKQITNVLKRNYRLNLKKEYVRHIVGNLNKRSKNDSTKKNA